MIKTITAVAVISAASFGLVGTAQAAGGAAMGANGDGDFYATPVQPGAPTDLPGERMIPGASQAAMMMDGMMRPMMEPMGMMPAAETTAAAAPMMRRHHHMMMHKHHMMHKKMMMKKAM